MLFSFEVVKILPPFVFQSFKDFSLTLMGYDDCLKLLSNSLQFILNFALLPIQHSNISQQTFKRSMGCAAKRKQIQTQQNAVFLLIIGHRSERASYYSCLVKLIIPFRKPSSCLSTLPERAVNTNAKRNCLLWHSSCGVSCRNIFVYSHISFNSCLWISSMLGLKRRFSVHRTLLCSRNEVRDLYDRTMKFALLNT